MSAVLALGSNLGDRLAHLRLAVRMLAACRVSPVYETVAVGGPAQGPYLNAVVLVPAAPPRALLAAARAAEAAAGRVRDLRWGPRTLDVDVIVCGDVVSTDPEVVVPHPRAHERAFVLVPWHDLQPDAVLPGRGPIAALLAGLDRGGVRRTDVELAP